MTDPAALPELSELPTFPGSADRWALRLSALLLVTGELVSFLMGNMHPGKVFANDHHAVFAEYAESTTWTAIHLGQFAGMALIIAGLVALFYALRLRPGAAGWISRFGVGAAVVALGLYAVLQAVDGVALKQVVDAWAQAPESEKTARFATAESVRWMEWAFRSYQSVVFGWALLLYGTVITWTARIPRPIGVLLGLSGGAYIAQGVILGSEGFSVANQLPTLLGYLTIIVASIWLLVVAWRMQATAITHAARAARAVTDGRVTRLGVTSDALPAGAFAGAR
jgi:hypothetical protein